MAAGAWIGAQAISYSIAYAIVLGGVYGVIQILCTDKKKRQTHINHLQSVIYTRQMPALSPNDVQNKHKIPMALLFSMSIFYCGYPIIF